MRRTLTLVAVAAAFVAATRSAPSQGFETPRSFELVEATIPELAAALESRQINSKQLVHLYLDRIAAYEGLLNAFVTVNPNAIAEAHQRDVERARGQVRGPLHGIPVVLKDIIHTTDMKTTGGALGFANLTPPYEATLTKKLRDAGAVILGKAVLTELANWVTTGMVNNYSAVGGYGINPYDARLDPRPDRNDGRGIMNTGGSSSGIPIAANLAAGGVGTETSGSILSPSNQTMLAGIKPTTGLISRYGIIPITANQDTAGPMTRDVASAAIMLGVMAGFDPNDDGFVDDPLVPSTADCLVPNRCLSDYTPFLQANGLAGARIGVPRVGFYDNLNDAQRAVVDEAIEIIEAQGATVIFTDIPSQADGRLPAWGICASASQNKQINPDTGQRNDVDCSIVLKYGAKRDFNLWLDSLGGASDIDTLSELIAFNEANAGNNAIRYGQARLIISDEMDLEDDRSRYIEDRMKDVQLTADEGIDAALEADNLDALLFGGSSSAGLAARPGYPTVTVPFGFVPNNVSGLPEGFNPKPQPYNISFTGTAWSEPTLIRLAYGFEQATLRRVSPDSAPPLKKDVKGKK